MSVVVCDESIPWKLTSPTPSASAAENVNKILTIGSSHFMSLSSPSRISSKISACFRKMLKTAWGESHLSNSTENGWALRSSFVSFLYFSDATSKIAIKLEVEELAGVGCVVDMVVRRGLSLTGVMCGYDLIYCMMAKCERVPGAFFPNYHNTSSSPASLRCRSRENKYHKYFSFTPVTANR